MSSTDVAEELADLRAKLDKDPSDEGALFDFEFLAKEHGKVAELEDLYLQLLDRGHPELTADVAGSLLYLYKKHDHLSPDWDTIVTLLVKQTSTAYAEDHWGTNRLVKNLGRAASKSEARTPPPIFTKITREKAARKAAKKAAAKAAAKRKLLKYVGTAVLVVAGLAGMNGVMALACGSLQGRQASTVSKWRPTPGTVTKTWITKDYFYQNKRYRFYPQVSYRYVIDGKSYNSNQIELGITPSFGTRKEAEHFLQPFRESPNITVYYDPQKPTTAALNHKSYKRLAKSNRAFGIVSTVVFVVLLPLGIILIRRSRT